MTTRSPTMYLPVLVSMEDVTDYLVAELEFDGTVDWSLVVREILRYELQGTVTQYGPYEGRLGSVLIQKSEEDKRFDDFTIDRILHEASVLALDALAVAVPTLTEVSEPVPYLFPPGSAHATLYVPCNRPEDLERFRGMLVPGEAVRNLIKGS